MYAGGFRSGERYATEYEMRANTVEWEERRTFKTVFAGIDHHLAL